MGPVTRGTFPVVGIGASAGGVEALEQFFGRLQERIGMAFIVVPHLDPSHASLMTELLRRVTPLEVSEAVEGVRVQPDHVYVIPPNKDMTIERGILRLESPKTAHGLRLPIDSFFRSLAQDQGDLAVGIILSGTGSDGTLGSRAIHGTGGLVLVQSPESAKYTGMPTSVAQTGVADVVLPPDKMPDQLKLIFGKEKRRAAPPPPEEDHLRKVLSLIRVRTGNDFSLYKKTTLNRRIEKRMNLLDIGGIGEYISRLKSRPEEISLLAKDMLVSVTQFFRDPDAFEALKSHVAAYASKLASGSTIRAWIPACGTGEEAYSIAIVIAECLEDIKQDLKVKLFGTDIDSEAVMNARAGRYADNIAADVSPARLRRYFVREEGGYRVRKEIREMIVYAVQDVTKDPPFTKLDLLSCRNLLIYFEPELQSRLLPLFHYSLKPGGLLFLGNSESVGKCTDLFEAADKKWKIFRAKTVFPAIEEEPWAVLPWVRPNSPAGHDDAAAKPRETDISMMAQRILLESFAPPSVIVNEKGEIFYIHGQTGQYLEPVQGRPNWNVFEMAREGIRPELRSGIHYTMSKGKPRRYEGLVIRADHQVHRVNVDIRPFGTERQAPGLAIVTFSEPAAEQRAKTESRGRSKSVRAKDVRLLETERELAYTRESLQATVEELQAANEELKSANEEMQSTNEEMQSTNEELETSREELQSMNEELVTVNSELQSKIDLLSRTEDDMKVLLENTNIGIIFLDTSLVIKRYTTEVTRIFKLIPGDVGRPIQDIRSNLEYDAVEDDARAVLESFEKREREVRTRDGESYLMRIMPYRTAESTIGGVILTFTNISGMKRANGPKTE